MSDAEDSGPSTQERSELDKILDDLTTAIQNEDLSSLSHVISKEANQEEIIADALAICCADGYHGAVLTHLLEQEKANANRASARVPGCKGKPPLVLVVCNSGKASSESRDASSGTVLNDPITIQRMDVEEWTGLNSILDTIAAIKILFQHGASLAASDLDFRTALSYIRQPEVAEALLENRDQAQVQQALSLKDLEGRDALMHTLFRAGTSSIAMILIQHGADTRTVDNCGRTSLMTAVWRQHASVVRELLKDPYIVNTIDSQGRNLWHHIASGISIAESWDPTIIKLLLTIPDTEADVNAIDSQGRNYLHYNAIWGGDGDEITTKLQKEQRILRNSVTAADVAGMTPLHFAAQFGKVDLVKWLLEQGAQVTARSIRDSTPLHLACGHGADAAGIVPLLLNQMDQSEIRARTDNNITPLHIAAYHGQTGIVSMLLKKEPNLDVNVVCEGGWTPLHLACAERPFYPIMVTDTQFFDSSRYLSIVETLLAHRPHGANINQKSRTSKTALHVAARCGHVDLVRLLLEQQNIPVAVKDNNGNTPILDAAKSENRDQIVPLLAPWKNIGTIPAVIQQTAKMFDADIVDIHKYAGAQRRQRLPVFDLLYSDFKSSTSHESGGTSTQPPNPDTYRWIHLPSNDLSWCQALLTKRFIENDFQEVEAFEALEQSLSHQQQQGDKPHALCMRPFCQEVHCIPGDHKDCRKHRTTSNAANHPLQILSRYPEPEHVERPTFPFASMISRLFYDPSLRFFDDLFASHSHESRRPVIPEEQTLSQPEIKQRAVRAYKRAYSCRTWTLRPDKVY